LDFVQKPGGTSQLVMCFIGGMYQPDKIYSKQIIMNYHTVNDTVVIRKLKIHALSILVLVTSTITFLMEYPPR
jgi:hypothetical protein